MVGKKRAKAAPTAAAAAQRSRAGAKAAAAGVKAASDPASGVPTSRSNQLRTTSPRAPREPAVRSAPAVLEHAFHVRPHVMATFRLPADVTRAEIERLCQLLQAVPFR